MTFVPDIAPAVLIRAIEAQYDIRIITLPRSLPPGFHSRAWLIDTTDGSWVVKLSHPMSDPIPKLERQIQLSNYLNQHGIHAPQLLPLSNGRFIATMTIGEQHYLMQLMQHQILARVQPELAPHGTLAVIGGLAARLHQILENYPERDTFVADRQKSADEWGSRDQGLWTLLEGLPDLTRISETEEVWFRTIDQRAIAFIQKHFPDPETLSMALLHGDLNFEHIQFLVDGGPYLYDFGDMCWGPIAHELAVLFLNIYCDSEVPFSQWETIIDHVLHGYTATQQLSHCDQAMVVVFILNRVVARANYSVELAHEVHLPIDWKGIQQTYRLAEYLLNQADSQ
jgi:Ser/Thr protein kinase RdoA (MazF antagonist)